MKNPKMSKRMKEYWASMTPDQRKERNRKVKKYWASLTPNERKERTRNWQKAGVEAVKTEEVRKEQSKRKKELWSDPEYKAKHSAGIKKAWDESPPERREKISQLSSNLSDETKQKRSEGLKRAWAERSDKCKEEISSKIRQTWQNKSDEEMAEFSEMVSDHRKKYWASMTLEERRELTKERTDAMHAAVGTDGPTSIEIAIQRALNQLGIEHEVHKVIGYLTVDIYIPELNLVVECDGNYWHNLPEQKHTDIRRDYWLRSQGYRVVRIWGSEINESAMTAIKTALGLADDEEALPQSLQLTFWDELEQKEQ